MIKLNIQGVRCCRKKCCGMVELRDVENRWGLRVPFPAFEFQRLRSAFQALVSSDEPASGAPSLLNLMAVFANDHPGFVQATLFDYRPETRALTARCLLGSKAKVNAPVVELSPIEAIGLALRLRLPLYASNRLAGHLEERARKNGVPVEPRPEVSGPLPGPEQAAAWLSKVTSADLDL